MRPLLLCLLAACACGIVVDEKWENWNRVFSAEASEYFQPADVAALEAVVAQARVAGARVKVVGGAHSFNDVGQPPEPTPESPVYLVSLAQINNVLNVDYENLRVTTEAGIRLYDLMLALESHGLAIENMGSVLPQSLAGAVSTATHGTGITQGAVSTFIKGWKMLLADGSYLVADDEEHKDLLDLATVSFGALGIFTEMTVEVVPMFRVNRTQWFTTCDAARARAPTLVHQRERFQWLCVPFLNFAFAWTLEGTDQEEDSDISCWVHGEALGGSCVGNAYMGLAFGGDPTTTEESELRYHEMECFMPLEQSYNAVDEFLAWQLTDDIGDWPLDGIVTFLRYVEGDELALSPMFGRDTGVMSVIVQGNLTWAGDRELFDRHARKLEEICFQHDGRLHWGKISYAGVDVMRTRWPAAQWDAFQALRSQVDPTGMFENDFLVRVLGPVQPAEPEPTEEPEEPVTNKKPRWVRRGRRHPRGRGGRRNKKRKGGRSRGWL